MVLCFYDGNDFVDAYLGRDRYRIVDGVAVPDNVVIEARVPPAYRANPGHFAADARVAAVVRRLRALRVYRFLELTSFLRREAAKRGDFVPDRAFMSPSFWSRPDYPPIATAAVDSTQRALERIVALCRGSGATLAIVAIPCREQVDAAVPEGTGYSIFLPQRFLADFARARDLPYLDLLPELRQWAAAGPGNLYVVHDQHFTTRGHRAAGEAITAFVRSLTAK